ncbi:unnamed protein product [Victoria cruziana]
MRRAGDVFGRRGGGAGGQRHLKQLSGGMKVLAGRLSVALVVLLICTISLFSTIKETRLGSPPEIDVNKLWRTADSDGWRPSSAPRSNWHPPPAESNGYLKVRCNGGLNQQRTAVGFSDIYDVEHFISSLKFDIRVVHSLPELASGKKKKKLKPFQLRPPRDAPISWYTTVALEKMKEHGAIYLTPFSHRLAEEIDHPEYQRLRCRVNFHALRFKPNIMKLSSGIVNRLRAQGHFISIHLRFEMDMLAFAGCLDIFNPEEQKILREYRQKNFANKTLVYSERRAIGKCPLTPEEVGLILRALGFDNSTRIYLAAGELFGGDRFMRPLRAMFPHLVNHGTIATPEELAAMNEDGHGLVASAVDYMVCLLSDIFMPTYDGPSNFANNLMGHRLYYGFRTTIQPDRKALAPVLIAQEEGRSSQAEFEVSVRKVMSRSHFGGPHKRLSPESFYTNSWPECFCQVSPENPGDKCPSDNVIDDLNSQLKNEVNVRAVAEEGETDRS